jgi:large subunit ribosomal protein L21
VGEVLFEWLQCRHLTHSNDTGPTQCLGNRGSDPSGGTTSGVMGRSLRVQLRSLRSPLGRSRGTKLACRVTLFGVSGRAAWGMYDGRPMYAVIKTGGKQYKVTQGQTLQVEKLSAGVGDTVTFPAVMIVNGSTVVAGPAASSASVSAKVVAESKGDKIVGFMYKPKARARKRWGHRQQYHVVEVTAISA